MLCLSKFIFFIFISLILSISSPSQMLTIKVIDSSKKPIEWATVTWDSNGGLVTNSEGVVTIPSYNEIKDSVNISSIGYKDLTIKKENIIENSMNIIALTEDIITLPPVLAGKGNNVVEKIYGCSFGKRKTTNYINSLNQRIELGVRISGYPQNSYIHSVSIYIPKEAEEMLPFRIKLYENKNDFPGKIILYDNIIIKNYQAGKWNTFNLEDKNISLPVNSFFIGIEWLITDKNTKVLSIGGANWPSTGEGITYISYGNRFGRTYSRRGTPMINVKITSY